MIYDQASLRLGRLPAPLRSGVLALPAPLRSPDAVASRLYVCVVLFDADSRRPDL
jgi:hypothetical protein